MSDLRVLTPETVKTLKNAAREYAAMFIMDRGQVINEQVKFDREYVIRQFYNFTYKDEFEFMVAEVQSQLGGEILTLFNARISELPPRSDEVFAQELAARQPEGYVVKES
jgi:hypothetical protein